MGLYLHLLTLLFSRQQVYLDTPENNYFGTVEWVLPGAVGFKFTGWAGKDEIVIVPFHVVQSVSEDDVRRQRKRLERIYGLESSSDEDDGREFVHK